MAVLAAACGISVRYLHETFRSGDVSVFESIMETRLQAARSMLETALGGPKTVSEIAYLCGFRDVAHFSRRFRRQFNAPPRDFLRRGR
ncbi:MAG: helix-turn-helix transcriptional regulator [Gammaproteobacteria bacterium]